MKTTNEIVAELGDQVKEFNEQNKGLLKSANEAKAAAEAIKKEYDEKVKALNEDLAAKNATIEEIQKSVLELKAKQGHIGGGAVQAVTSVEDLIAKSFESEKAIEVLKSCNIGQGWETEAVVKKTPFKSKAAGTIIVGTTGNNNVSGATIVGVPSWSDQIWGRGYDDLHFRDIFRVVDSQTGTFAFYRSKTPVGEGSVAFVAPAGQKPLIDKDLELITVNADYLAGVADIAKQSLQDLPMLQSYLNEELINDYLDVETFSFFTSLLAAATGNATMSGDNDYAIEGIIDLIKNQRKAKNRADRIVTSPDIWAEVLKTRPNDFSLPNAVTITPSGAVSIVGIPMTTVNTDAFGERQVLVGDSRKAAVMQVVGEGLKLELFRQHDKAVYQNIVSLRVEARVAPLIFRPDAFIKATLPAYAP